mmetsp:Transcript_120176/g.340206  ORF Transcript_120176/g.340206 Transcript_120176/m.340206 type:complete len:268 (-) Transcript_120176:364-1167(-)
MSDLLEETLLGQLLLVALEDLGVQAGALGVKALLHAFSCELERVEGPIEGFRQLRRPLGQILSDILVLLRLEARWAPRGVPMQQALHEVHARQWCIRESRRDARLLPWPADLFQEAGGGRISGDPSDVLRSRATADVAYPLDHFEVVTAREQRLPAVYFRDDAPHRPKVYCRRVARRQQHHLWGPVPARDDILRQLRFTGEGAALGFRHVSPCEAKITDHHVTIGIDENVGGLQVSVRDTGSVEVGKPAENLACDGPDVAVLVLQLP